MRQSVREASAPSGAGIRLGLVAAEFNPKVTDKMLMHAKGRSAEIKARVTYVCRVPGAYDLPLVVQDLLKKDDVDAVVTLGAIIKGETKHDEVIASVVADKLAELALRYGKPVALGVSGPSMTWDQAASRAEEFAIRAVEAAVKLVTVRKHLAKVRGAVHTLVVE